MDGARELRYRSAGRELLAWYAAPALLAAATEGFPRSLAEVPVFALIEALAQVLSRLLAAVRERREAAAKEFAVAVCDWLRAHADRSPRTWATAQGLMTLPLAVVGYGALWLWSAVWGG